MKNKIRFRQLGRVSEHRKALFRNMVTSLITFERIRTTLAKAKEMRRIADRVVTWAKDGRHERRIKALGFVRNKDAVEKLWTELGPRYASRAGGYCRVLRCGFRSGDRAPMAVLEYVDRPGEIRKARPASGPSAASPSSTTAASAGIGASVASAAATASAASAAQQRASSRLPEKEQLR